MSAIKSFNLKEHFSPFKIAAGGRGADDTNLASEVGFVADPSLLIDGYQFERLVPSSLSQRGFSVSNQLYQSVYEFLGAELAAKADRGIEKPRLWLLQPKLFTDTVAAGILGHPSGESLSPYLRAPLQSIRNGLLQLLKPSSSSGTGFRSPVKPAFQNDLDGVIRQKSDLRCRDGSLIDGKLAELSDADGLVQLCDALEDAVSDYVDLLIDLFDDNVLRTLLGLWPVSARLFDPALFRRTSYDLTDIKDQHNIDVAVLGGLYDSFAKCFDDERFTDRDRVAVSVFLDSLILAVTGGLDVSRFVFMVNGDSAKIGRALGDPSVWGFLSRIGVSDVLVIAV